MGATLRVQNELTLILCNLIILRMFLAIALISIGTILLLERLDVIEGGLSTYWPVILIALGVSMLVGRARRRT